MARKQREKSVSGIYHVMLRGINKQDLFLDQNDFETMVRALERVRVRRDEMGNVLGNDNCTIYAYCILHNHLHVLLKEGALSVSEVMKRLQDRFVLFYNRKYDRVGHLFQNRFASEPVDDDDYFHQLLRYIHRNPVKAMEAQRPEDYRFSSWREYLAAAGIIKGSDPLMIPICETKEVLSRYGADSLVAWVNELSEDQCMDMDSFKQPMPEAEAWERLAEISQMESLEYFKQLRHELQLQYLSQLVEEGASIRQASRLSSLSYRKLWNHLHPEEFKEQQLRRSEERKAKRKLVSSRGLTP